MRYLLFFIISIIGFMNVSLKAQDGWSFQTNPLDSVTVGKVQFVSQTEGWISASQGHLLHTTNGGAYWTIVTPFPADTVISMSDPAVTMSWVNETHGWKINAMGTGFDDLKGAVIHKTTDGGVMWEKNILSTDSGDFGLQIQFIDENNGWASVYNFQSEIFKLYNTSDGGNIWSLIPTTAGGFFYFVDVNIGWLYSGGPDILPPYEIMKTTNGGVNWSVQYSDSTSGSFLDLQFVDLNNGWVVGENGKILKTTDGGIHWDSITNTGVTDFNTYHSKCVFFLDENNGWIGSDRDEVDPIVLHTQDGGQNWVTQITPIDGTLPGGDDIFSIFIWDINHGWFTGESYICNFEGTGIEENSTMINNYELFQNYPNPFNPSTTLSFSLSKEDHVKLSVYNMKGELVQELVNEKMKKGLHHVDFNAKNLISGEYVYVLEANGDKLSNKMIFVK